MGQCKGGASTLLPSGKTGLCEPAWGHLLSSVDPPLGAWGSCFHRSAFYQGQDKPSHLWETAAGHSGPGSLFVSYTLVSAKPVRMNRPEVPSPQSHQVDRYTRQHPGLDTDLQRFNERTQHPPLSQVLHLPWVCGSGSPASLGP